MKLLLIGLTLFSVSNFAVALPNQFKVATYNMQGWVDITPTRQKALTQILKEQNLNNDISIIMTQESMENIPTGTTKQLAKELGWNSFAQKRTSDGEGLGFLYQRGINVLSTAHLQIKAKHNSKDFSRMALTMQIDHSELGLIRFVNVHLAHLTSAGGTRKKQLREVMQWVTGLEANKPSNLVVFGGDFNTGPKLSYYNSEFTILSASPFNFTRVPNQGASYTWINKKTGTKKSFDHLFLSRTRGGLESVKGEARVFTPPTVRNLSDHNMVIMTVTGKPKSN